MHCILLLHITYQQQGGAECRSLRGRGRVSLAAAVGRFPSSLIIITIIYYNYITTALETRSPAVAYLWLPQSPPPFFSRFESCRGADPIIIILYVIILYIITFISKCRPFALPLPRPYSRRRQQYGSAGWCRCNNDYCSSAGVSAIMISAAALVSVQ